MTQKQAIQAVRALGLSLRVVDGEYIVRDRANGATYHTNDRDDALQTARAMALLNASAKL